MRLIPVALVAALALVAGAAFPSEQSVQPRAKYSGQTIRWILQRSWGEMRTVDVRLEVVIGGKIHFMSKERMIYGSTPTDLLLRHFRVSFGKVCSDEREVWAVDGFTTDLEEGKYWRLSVNGSYADVSPFATVLREGDVVVWEYIEGDGQI